ncbi:MAG: glycerol-3-phosphate 1-O-acyltransferase PlsY [Nitrospiraceae bacterium]|nr:MAG: glycerol-3-phosphate 1-O-acyltransferase PlsY [Nitrospiraceae bacterium]
MNTVLFLYLLVPVAFLIGSIPFGLIFSRGSGVDLRSTGSRNIGATNVLRSVGKVPAILTLLSDGLKGAVPVIICKFILSAGGSDMSVAELWMSIVGLAAVLGHMFSVFLGFKGGKGVATGIGVVAAYSPVVSLLLIGIWITVAIMTKYSSLAAIVSVALLPLIYLMQGGSFIKISFGIILAALIIVKHKTNINNLLSGRESKIGNKKVRTNR